ncbi:MAG TPA: hypothetical protein VMR49_01845 [Candidatus Paceibacterota bacterium]|nr:hypothetical protein [Candidatus Paceibacterota bacterium]
MSESKVFKIVIYSFGIAVAACLIFQAGVFVGFHRVSFGHDWENNYSMNFGTPYRNSLIPIGNFGNLPNAHGAIGKIIKIELPTIIVMDDKDKTEKVILINDDTEIHNMRKDETANDLKVDDSVVVIGSPDSKGQIEAKLIRIIPSPIGNSGPNQNNPNSTK